MNLVSVQWNGQWGRRRRVIEVRRDGDRFEVEARQGEQTWIWDPPSEEIAWAIVRDLKAQVPEDEWRDTTSLYQTDRPQVQGTVGDRG